MGGVGIITLLPVLARTWDTGIQWVSLAITLYMIPYIIFQLFSGSVAHVFNTRRTLLFGFGVYSLGGFLCGSSSSLGTLMGSRFIQGLGAAFIAPIVMALIGEMVDPRRMGKAMGLLGVMYTIGVTMGPLIAGVLEVHFGWPWFFFFLMAFALCIGALYWLTSSGAGEREMGSGRIKDALALMKQSYSYPNVRFLGFAALFLFIGYIGLMTFIADHMKSSFSVPSDRIGFILSMAGFSGIMASPIAGILGDRFGRRNIAYAGGMVMVVSILGLESMGYSYENYLLLFALFGIGAATTWTSLNTLAVEIVPDLRKPVSSIYNSLKLTGYGLAPLVLSFLYVPFSISAVRWACIASILISLVLASRMQNLLR